MKNILTILLSIFILLFSSACATDTVPTPDYSADDMSKAMTDELFTTESHDNGLSTEDAPRLFVFRSLEDLIELKSALSRSDEELLAFIQNEQNKTYYGYSVDTRETAQSVITLLDRIETVYIDEDSGYKMDWLAINRENGDLYVQYFNSAGNRIEIYTYIDMQNDFDACMLTPVYGQLGISGNNVDLHSTDTSTYLIGTLLTRNASVAIRIQKSGDNVPSGVTNISDNAYATITTFDFTE